MAVAIHNGFSHIHNCVHYIKDRAFEEKDKAMELAESLERKVTVKEVAEFAGISEKSVREAMEISGYRIEVIEDDRAQ